MLVNEKYSRFFMLLLLTWGDDIMVLQNIRIGCNVTDKIQKKIT